MGWWFRPSASLIWRVPLFFVLGILATWFAFRGLVHLAFIFDSHPIGTFIFAPALLPFAALPALCLTADVSVDTAITNDISFHDVFLRQIIALGRPADIVVGISTSGGSENILRGLREASGRGMLTIGLSGGGGGTMATESALDFHFSVRSSSIHRIQEVQATMYGVLCDLSQHAVAI